MEALVLVFGFGGSIHDALVLVQSCPNAKSRFSALVIHGSNLSDSF